MLYTNFKFFYAISYRIIFGVIVSYHSYHTYNVMTPVSIMSWVMSHMEWHNDINSYGHSTLLAIYTSYGCFSPSFASSKNKTFILISFFNTFCVACLLVWTFENSRSLLRKTALFHGVFKCMIHLSTQTQVVFVVCMLTVSFSAGHLL